MPVPEVEVGNCFGAFQCDLQMLSKLLGFPEGVEIKYAEMAPYTICNQHAIRFVVEDAENLPALKEGEELTAISPRFRLGPGNYHEFVGWKVYEQHAVDPESS